MQAERYIITIHGEEVMEMPTLEAVKQLKESISRSHTTSTMQEVEFTLYAPDAKKVCIAGRFNDWNTKSIPMKKSKDGAWRIKMKLPRGKCEYKYFVDGAWAQDISGAGMIPNPFGTSNCVIDVQ
jgi:1,4-alpha-glucan branching enzyme